MGICFVGLVLGCCLIDFVYKCAQANTSSLYRVYLLLLTLDSRLYIIFFDYVQNKTVVTLM